MICLLFQLSLVTSFPYCGLYDIYIAHFMSEKWSYNRNYEHKSIWSKVYQMYLKKRRRKINVPCRYITDYVNLEISFKLSKVGDKCSKNDLYKKEQVYKV